MNKNEKYTSIVNRDKNYSNKFFYGVISTKIFCIPSCPAKIPKKENILFFNTFLEAKNAGYRACKRCHPESLSIDEKNKKIIFEICKIIEKNPIGSLEELSNKANMSKYHFHRVFTHIIGLTPKQYQKEVKAGNIRLNLHQKSVTKSIYDSGFNSSSRFYEKSNEILGMKPKDFKNGAQNMNIYIAMVKTSLGYVLIGQTDKGVCSISIGEDPHILSSSLEKLFPLANFITNNQEYEKTVEKVIQVIENPQYINNIPLDIQGTIFQKKVWNILQKIPVGKTLTYSEIGDMLNMPKAARAVAKACATNNIAILIPCHRVVAKNGDISGYRWGVEKKKILLKREGLI